MRYIVVFAGYEMTAAQIEPLDAIQPFSKLFFDMLQGVFQCITAAFAMTVAMKTLDISW